jgi:DNA-binding MarR family transcriptional regulator
MIDKPQLNIDSDLHSPVEDYMRAMFTHLMASMARNLRDQNLSLSQVAALHLLDLNKAMRVGDLGSELQLSMPAASRLANEMVVRGLMERREDENDRRAKIITLSPAGRELIEVISRQRVDEANEAMVAIQGIVSERFRKVFAEMNADGLTRADDPGK